MSISETDKQEIIRIAKSFGATRMWVFGSALKSDEPRDIDLAVQGLPPRDFYRFYSLLDDALGKPVDLIDMDSEDPMRHIVSAYGEIIYG